ncbi:MAG: TRAP transporter substrate-binding protein [Bosea sp.]|nr:TRAP transporter substrate-binding protein [Bosea sp. (in: a-proteobacteria)]
MTRTTTPTRAGSGRIGKRLLGAIAGVALMASAGAAGARELSLQSTFPGGFPVLSESIDYFIRNVDNATAGQVKFKAYDAGKLSPPFEVLGNVGNGSIDSGWSYAGYWAGKYPAANLFGSIPFGPDAIKYLAWIYEGGGLAIWQEIYAKDNVVPMPCGTIISEAAGWFRKEIKSLDDMKGLKFRIGGLGGKILAKVGATPTAVPASEVYLALETGKIDATELSYPAIDQKAGFSRVAKNYYFPGWHQPSGFIEFLINKGVWDKFTPGQRLAVEEACKATSLWAITRASVIQKPALEAFQKDGVKVGRLPDTVLAALEKASTEVMDEEAARDPLFKKALESYRAFSAIYDEYNNLNRLK